MEDNGENSKLNYAKQDTQLAKKRTTLAAMRTLLSHIRTSAVMLSLAFAFMKLDKEHPIDALTITLLVLAGVFIILGFVDYFVAKNFVKKV